MCCDWSSNDTKVELLEVCKDRGLEADPSMLKADIIAMLEADDEALVQEVIAEPTPAVPRPPPVPKKTGGYVAVRKETINFDTGKHTVESLVPKKPLVSRVLVYLQSRGDKRVPYQQIIKACGSGAKEEVKRLLAEGKVTQYRTHNKFWFQAIK